MSPITIPSGFAAVRFWTLRFALFLFALLGLSVAPFLHAETSPAPLTITLASLPAANIGSAYSRLVTTKGGKAPLKWNVSAGALPGGLTLNSFTGEISGIPSTSGNFAFQIAVSDAASAQSSHAFTLKVSAPPLSLITTTLPNAKIGAAYTLTLTAAGGKPPYTWAVSAGNLPDGLLLDRQTGQITGSPVDEGTWLYSYPFRPYIVVTDSASATAAKAFTFFVLPGTPATPTKYVLTVINGSGSGTFAANTTVTISANSAPSGKIFSSWGGATVANATSPTTTLVMPQANVTVTASYAAVTTPIPQYTLTVVNGSGSGSYAANTAVSITAGGAPAGQQFSGWTGAAVNDAASASTTLIMPAGNVSVTANFVLSSNPASTTIPQPVTGHPRLWITTSDLPRLRSWAVASNPIYQQGQLPLLNTAISDYNNKFFPGGVANPTNPDFGDTQGYSGLITEQYALIFAFHSLIDPSPAARIQHAQRARNLIMVAFNEAAKGALSGAPFRDPLFSVYNRANATSEAWPLIVDWIYNATDANNQPILTAQDKATIRAVFLRWANECLNASTTGGDHPSPIGATNTPSLLPGGNAYRMASNNYYLGHARLLTLMSLAFDPTDDAAIDPSFSVAVQGNSLRSYIANATGAWLYQEFAMLGDPAIVRSSLGLAANASVGLSSGGLPPEGMLYGHSYGFILGQLLALKTAGFADPVLSGPQVALANNAPVWDRFMKGMATSLVPAAQIPASQSYLGPVYQMASYGDILRLWITPDFVQPFALLNLLDQQNGDASRVKAERWFAVNAVEGGSGNLLNRIQNPWSYGVQDALLYYLLLDPAAAPAIDPRPNYPTAFYDAPQGRLVEHSDWTANAAMFDFRCSWISINHQQADANQFEFYRKGEWLTKGVANYDNNFLGLTTEYHNTLSLKNWCSAGIPTNLGWWESPFWANGSQWQLGGSAGDPSATVSVQPAYTYVFGDTTNLYNRPSQWTPSNAALDVLHASRSILWLKPDHIVIYDRATSKTPGLFKRFNLALTAAPSLNANVVTTTTSSGQHLYVSALLPAGATFSAYAVGPELNPMAELESTTHRIVLEDPSTPTDVRFLHVLQGADANAPVDPTVLVQGSAGTAFDGALILDTVVLFKRDVTTVFTSLTYTVPATTAHHYLTGLTPNSGYTTSLSANGSTITVTITPGGTQIADIAGVLAF